MKKTVKKRKKEIWEKETRKKTREKKGKRKKGRGKKEIRNNRILFKFDGFSITGKI